MRPWPRYVPGRSLPAQAHMPGRTPRPPRPETEPDAERGTGAGVGASAERASVDAAFLWGLDLYNHGYPWEAHEVWEALWREAPQGSAPRQMLQALIQCAAAVVHARGGRAAAQRRLAERALARLDAVQALAGSLCLGIDVPGLARAVRAYSLAPCAEDWPRIALAPGAAPGIGEAPGAAFDE